MCSWGMVEGMLDVCSQRYVRDTSEGWLEARWMYAGGVLVVGLANRRRACVRIAVEGFGSC
jgi:hypothetical protein